MATCSAGSRGKAIRYKMGIPQISKSNRVKKTIISLLKTTMPMVYAKVLAANNENCFVPKNDSSR